MFKKIWKRLREPVFKSAPIEVPEEVPEEILEEIEETPEEIPEEAEKAEEEAPKVGMKGMPVKAVIVKTDDTFRPKLQRHKMRAARLKLALIKLENKDMVDTLHYQILNNELEQHELHIKQHKQYVRRS